MDIFTILTEAKTPSSSNSLTIKEDNKIDYSGGIGMDSGGTNEPEGAAAPEPTEPTDYTMSDMGADDFGTGGQEQPTDQQDTTSTNEEPQEEDEATKLNKLLLNDFTDLYYSIKANSSKLDTIDSVDIVTTQILIRAKDHLSKLHAYTYNYIIRHFTKSSYAQNLYVYKNIIALYKITIEMVKKIRKSDTVK